MKETTPELHIPSLLVLIPRSGFTSDAKFCASAQVDPSLFVRIKKGTKRATPAAITRMAKALDVPVCVITRGGEVAA